MHGRDTDTVVSRPIAWVSPSSLGAEQSPEGAMHRSPQIIHQVHDVWLVWDEDRLQQHDGAGSCPGRDGTVLSMEEADRKLRLSVQELQSQRSSLYTHHNPFCACLYQGGHSRSSKHPSVSGSVLRG